MRTDLDLGVIAVGSDSPPSQMDQTRKIARLRRAVETGTYAVDLDALASRIVTGEVIRRQR